MGLDITAYESLTRVSDSTDHDAIYERGNVCLYVNPHFPAQADVITNGEYATAGNSYRFRAGSYSGYNQWRNLLCRFANNMDAETLYSSLVTPSSPRNFASLIAFTDCEGVIGAQTSAILAQEFAEWRSGAAQFAATLLNGDYWLSLYDEWAKAFKLAAGSGAVVFH